MDLVNTVELTSIDDIQKAYEKLEEQEETVKKELEAHVARQYQLESKLKNITKEIPRLHDACVDAEKLSEMVQHTAVLAEKVSGKVRRMDMIRARVSECQKRVHDLVDLQSCSEGIRATMASEDYEKAAAHVHRYLSIDKMLVKKTADDVAEDFNSLNETLKYLDGVTDTLGKIISKKFDKAMKDKDSASIQKFFKLYPLLNKHDEGLERYSVHLSAKLHETCEKNLAVAKAVAKASDSKEPNIIFADTMSLLLEGTARVIEAHQGLVDTYYGPGKLVLLVKHLQRETDTLSRRVIDEMVVHRRLPALRLQMRDKAGELDPKAFDVLLGELTTIQTKVDLYFRFVRQRVVAGLEAEPEASREAVAAEAEALLRGSVLSRKLEDVQEHYLALERFYMAESMRKALAGDTLQPGATVSTMVDDVYFIVRKSIRRASSTGSLDAVCVVVNGACALLQDDYCAALEKQVESYPSSYLDMAQAYMGHQAPKLEQAELRFLAYLNNADVSLEYTEILGTTVNEETRLCFPAMDRRDCDKFTACLSELSSVTTKLRSKVVEQGIEQLRRSVVTPRLDPWVQDFASFSHDLSAEEFPAYMANDPFAKGLLGHVGPLLASFKDKLTAGNYERLLEVLSGELATRLQRAVLRVSFSRLGGLAFDKEVRSLLDFLTKANSWAVRDRFARLSQVAGLLNLETVAEVGEWHNSLSTPRLRLAEVRDVLRRRVDFKEADIANIKL